MILINGRATNPNDTSSFLYNLPRCRELLQLSRESPVIWQFRGRPVHYRIELLEYCGPLSIGKGAQRELQLGEEGEEVTHALTHTLTAAHQCDSKAPDI